MNEDLRVAPHDELTTGDLEQLQHLFDREYLDDYGPWTPDAPYGYSGADVHVVAFQGERLIGNVGFQRRSIAVGSESVIVAGTGGVLVADVARGSGLGRRLMQRAQREMASDPLIEFGYLGCRPAVVPFYESAGWRRIAAAERHLSRLDPNIVEESADSPVLICTVGKDIADWSVGHVDLRGTPW